MSHGDALEVFFSYSRRDQALRERLDTHLALLKRQGVLHTWFDGVIGAGEEIEPEIFRRLDAADVILLLVSPDFVASEFCWSREMTRAMERHEAGEARVIPILLRPVDNWQSAPFGKLKALPEDGLPATEWRDLDQAFRDVTAGIRTAIEGLARRRSLTAAGARPLQVVILIGHSVAHPLPEAVEMAKATVADFQSGGLAVELRVDQATTANFEREAEEGCDLLIYYGHGLDDGRLSLADGPKSYADLSQGGLARLWQETGAALIFACYGDRFAASLPCPWIGFTEPILTQAPKGFLHALIRFLAQGDLAAAVEKARAHCAREMASEFPRVMRFSPAPLPHLQPSVGAVRLRRLSPALAKTHRLDLGSLQDDQDHLDDPFVGRVQDLETLLRLPSPYDDRPPQWVVWVHGDAGFGKSALLRQLAILVRDLVFREAEEPVWLLHLYCYKYTRRSEVEAALCERAGVLYGLDPKPASFEALMAALETSYGTRGTHVWILDDLTYLSVQPDSSEEAVRLVSGLRHLANSHGLRWQLVVSSRRRPGSLFNIEDIQVGPLTAEEARDLAFRVWFSGRRPPGEISIHEVAVGAMQLFRAVQSTAQYKRALILAPDRGMTYRAYADALTEGGNLDALEQLEAAQRMLAFEVHQLAALEAKHGFAYRVFLKIYYPLIARAAFFTSAELENWCGDSLMAEGARISPARAYAYGLAYLVRLNFLFVENRAEGQVFSLPPNQRWSMRSLSDPAAVLPTKVPRRGARERLSLALERVERGDLEAIGDLLLMAADYQNDLDDPSCAAAVFTSMLMQAELARPDAVAEMRILGELVNLYETWRHGYPADETEASEPVAKALFNQGALLDALGRSEEALHAYEELVARFGDRPEPALAEQVAKALFNKGFSLGVLGRSGEALSAYGELVSRFGDRPELALAESVAKALVNQGVRLGLLGRSEEELKVYDELASHFGDRPEPVLAEQVAKALVNKGVRLSALGQAEEALRVYDDLVLRFGDRPEPTLVQQVATALGDKGWRQYELGQYADSVASSRASLDRNPGATVVRCNLALALLHLGDIEAAREAYTQTLEKFETPEDFQHLVLQDLDDALARQPDLPGGVEIREFLISRGPRRFTEALTA
jgi:tetratricopeptide (TPR) repeat protein